MKTKLTAFALTTALALPGAGFAAGMVELTDANTAQVRQVLTEQGYSVRKITLEKGMYEAYAKKDGKRMEILLDGDFTIVKVGD